MSKYESHVSFEEGKELFAKMKAELDKTSGEKKEETEEEHEKEPEKDKFVTGASAMKDWQDEQERREEEQGKLLVK